jgi:hypothetical protein
MVRHADAKITVRKEGKEKDFGIYTSLKPEACRLRPHREAGGGSGGREALSWVL